MMPSMMNNQRKPGEHGSVMLSVEGRSGGLTFETGAIVQVAHAICDGSSKSSGSCRRCENEGDTD